MQINVTVRLTKFFSITNDPINLANEVREIGNTILDGQDIDMTDFVNRVTKGFNSNMLVSGAQVHLEGGFNKVKGNLNLPPDGIFDDIELIHVEGQNNKVIFSGDGRSGQNNKVIFSGDGRSGVNMTGQSSHFLFDKDKTRAEDTYNYSN